MDRTSLVSRDVMFGRVATLEEFIWMILKYSLYLVPRAWAAERGRTLGQLGHCAPLNARF